MNDEGRHQGIDPDNAHEGSINPKDWPQWVVWRSEHREGQKKPTKVPYNPNTPTRRASSTDPTTWSTRDTARITVIEQTFDGIGFVVTADDPFVGIDLDDCVDAETGHIHDWAQAIVVELDSYTEYSPSRTGIHIFVLGRLPDDGPWRKGSVEMYDRARYFTVTQNHVPGTRNTIEPRQGPLTALRARVWPPVAETPPAPQEPTSEANLAGPATFPNDDRIIEIAMNAKNGAEFTALWNGDTSAYDNDESKADHHLARALAFYAQGDPDAVERIFNRSERGQREKWRSRAKYRGDTIRNAMVGMTEFYTPPSASVAPAKPLKIVSPPQAEPPGAATIVPIHSARDLMKRDLPPVKWIVQDVLPEGVMLFAGKSKIRKSWLVMGLCVAVASGGYAFGTTPVEQGAALYLALEDNDRRIQRRLGKILGEAECPRGFDYATDFPRIDEGGDEYIRAWLDNNKSARLIVIDTLAKIRPRTRNQGYQEDYEALERVVAIANQYQVGIIVVHHTRKAEAEDVVDEINATTGLMGGVDGFLILKTKRQKFEGSMFITGREIEEEREIALRWDQEIHGWRMTDQGEADEGGVLTPERRDLLNTLANSEGGKPMRLSDIIKATGKTRQSTGYLLKQLIDDLRVEKTTRGLYKLATHEEEVTLVEALPDLDADGEALPPPGDNWAHAPIEDDTAPTRPTTKETDTTK